jgi:rsbT co-antagonist protein RsbR
MLELQSQCTRFLDLLIQATASAGANVQSQSFDTMRTMMEEISRARALQGFTLSETATLVFSMKQPLFTAIREELGSDAAAIAQEMWNVTELLDQLGLYTAEVFLKSPEDIIRRQQEEMLELSTPVVKLWDGILALPLIGTWTVHGPRWSWNPCWKALSRPTHCVTPRSLTAQLGFHF